MLLWEAKTGGKPGSPDFGLRAPGVRTINDGAAKLAETVANASGGPWNILDFRVGSLNPNARGYDQALAHFFNTWSKCSGGWCIYDFPFGVELHVSVPRDGVIAYYLSFDAGPEIIAIGLAILFKLIRDWYSLHGSQVQGQPAPGFSFQQLCEQLGLCRRPIIQPSPTLPPLFPLRPLFPLPVP
jgi:hypothetical protein